ncbi:MAG: cysteine desulfurase [Alphaproteobacteria bacterium]|jgi:cysteine desulfurase|nr:cysteine desulfurase [Alphaproteobacteria bacterium]
MGKELPVYLDHNATTTIRPVVRDAVARALDLTGNASSVHGAGRTARKVIEDARDQIAALVGAKSSEVVFTSGGTEANNLAIRGLDTGSKRPRVLASAVEHVSVLKAAANVEPIAVDAQGVVDLAALDAMLAESPAEAAPALVSVMLANNETGVIQPVAEVAAIAETHGALVHCDAIQAAGKIPVDMAALGVHLMSLSAHKFGGPAGVGALVVAEKMDQPLSALVFGGGQERGRRAGSENLPGISGMGVAAEETLKHLPDSERLSVWRERIEQELCRHGGVRVLGADALRLGNTSCLTMPGVASERQVIAFDLAEIALSAGSACSSGKVEPSHVLAAMGVAANDADTAIRVSLGWTTTEQDIDRFLAAWAEIFARAHVATDDVEAA